MGLFILGLVYISEIHRTMCSYATITVLFSLCFFSSHRVLALYISFELLSLPIVLRIYHYGAQPEKISAIYYILVYTGRFGISFLYIIITLERWEVYISPIISIFMLGIFAVKCPIFILHLWLPKAHVEAPTTASILLAGLLLKVGLYGILKVRVFINLRFS